MWWADGRGAQEDNKEYMEVARQLAQEGETAYRMLTDSTPGFYDYYYETTVVNQIALMNMGSRPARRQSGDRSKKSLRAIPWVFAWAQVCLLLVLLTARCPAYHMLAARCMRQVHTDMQRSLLPAHASLRLVCVRVCVGAWSTVSEACVCVSVCGCVV